MLGIIDFEIFLLGAIFIVLIPGPNSLFVLVTAANHGILAGYRAAVGIFLGDAILIVATVMGVAGLMRTFPALFLTLKVFGALYLAWLGFNLVHAGLAKFAKSCKNLQQVLCGYLQLISKLKIKQKQAKSPTLAQKFSSDYFVKALVLSLSNPKAILFFLAFFVQFVDMQAGNIGLSFLVLGLVVELLSALYLSVLIFGGAHLAAWFSHQKHVAASGICVTGLIFIIFAWQLGCASL